MRGALSDEFTLRNTVDELRLLIPEEQRALERNRLERNWAEAEETAGILARYRFNQDRASVDLADVRRQIARLVAEEQSLARQVDLLQQQVG